MKRLIVYDLDGTLADTLQDITYAANAMLHDFRLPAVSTDQVRSYVGRGMRELVKNCLGNVEPEQVDQAMAVYRSYYGKHMLDTTKLFPGVRKLLEHFSSHRQAVITNKPDPYASQVVQALGLSGFFIEVIAGDGEFPKKPDPTALRTLMRRLDVIPEHTVFVGDSTVDVFTGRNAGVVTVAVCHGFDSRSDLEAAGPDALVDDFAQLLELAKVHSW